MNHTSKIAALALGLSLALGLAGCGNRGKPADTAAAAPAIGGPFQMSDQTGKPVDQSVLNGKWSAVFFGYTYCPDVCPTTLQTLGSATELLGPKAKDFQVVFVTVDPARDTPAQLKDYLSSASFPRGTIGLTGTPDQTAKITGAYKVYFQKSGTGANYSVDHSSAIYLMNPKGQFDSVLRFDMTPQQIRDQVAKAMDQGA
jgi:protein SCO1/2